MFIPRRIVSSRSSLGGLCHHYPWSRGTTLWLPQSWMASIMLALFQRRQTLKGSGRAATPQVCENRFERRRSRVSLHAHNCFVCVHIGTPVKTLRSRARVRELPISSFLYRTNSAIHPQWRKTQKFWEKTSQGLTSPKLLHCRLGLVVMPRIYMHL